MKRTFAFILALVMIFAMTACGAKEKEHEIDPDVFFRGMEPVESIDAQQGEDPEKTMVNEEEDSDDTADGAHIYSGTCGEDAQWEFNADTGAMLITGTGEMTNYNIYDRAPWYEYTEQIKTVRIDGVSTVGATAFPDCYNLTELEISDSVELIEDSAFQNCSGLKKMELPDSLIELESSAFSNCDGLTELVIPDHVTTIEDHTFGGCDELTKVKFGKKVDYIGHMAFMNATKLSSIEMPESVAYIGTQAFDFCDSLATVYYGGTEKQWESIKISDHNDDLLNANIQYAPEEDVSEDTEPVPESRVFEPGNYTYTGKCGDNIQWGFKEETGALEIIGTGEMYHCAVDGAPWDSIGLGWRDKIISVYIDYGVTTIGSYAFAMNGNLTSVQMPNSIEIIYTNAFFDCDSLTSIEIPDGVTRLRLNTFAYCDNLASVKIPVSVTKIENQVFNKSDNLKDIYYGGTKGKWIAVEVGKNNDSMGHATVHYEQ